MRHTITTVCGVTVVQDTELDMVWTLTPCCRATAKFMDSGVPGADEILACRGCYQPVADRYGWGGAGAVHLVLEDNGCPIPHDCADNVLWALDREAERAA